MTASYLFTVNTASSTISRYTISADGTLTLLGSTPFRRPGGAFDARLRPTARRSGSSTTDPTPSAVSTSTAAISTELASSPTPLCRQDQLRSGSWSPSSTHTKHRQPPQRPGPFVRPLPFRVTIGLHTTCDPRVGGLATSTGGQRSFAGWSRGTQKPAIGGDRHAGSTRRSPLRGSVDGERRRRGDVVRRRGVLVELDDVASPARPSAEPDALMSPCVSASAETGNVTCTVFDWPASSVTRVKPTSRCGGTTTPLTGWATYTGTMSVPAA